MRGYGVKSLSKGESGIAHGKMFADRKYMGIATQRSTCAQNSHGGSDLSVFAANPSAPAVDVQLSSQAPTSVWIDQSLAGTFRNSNR